MGNEQEEVMHNRSYTRTTLGALVLLALSWSQPGLAAIHVELGVNTAGGTPQLEVTGNSSQCPDGPMDCIQVAKGSSPNIFFYLEDACKPDGAAYRLTAISISMVKGIAVSGTNPLPQVVYEDFFADPANGKIDLVKGNNNKNKIDDDRIKFKNKNSDQYTVYYRITAELCTDKSQLVELDPSIRNYGK
jgi:hypothetical protein